MGTEQRETNKVGTNYTTRTQGLGKEEFLSLTSVESGGSNRTATALAKNIASPKMPDLFDGEEIAKRESRISTEKAMYRMERKGKPVFLSNKDTRLTYILSSSINIYEEDVRQLIEWTEKVERAGRMTKELSSQIPNPIARTFSLKEIAMKMYGRAKKEQIEEVRKAIKRLQEIEQVQILGKAKVKISAPILQKDFSFEDLTEEERGVDIERVIFGTIFLWNIQKRFAYLSPEIFKIWGSRGSGTETELFGTLFSTIISICHAHQQAATEARKRLKREFENVQMSGKEKKEKITYDVKEALTYRESFEYIKSRISTDYTTTKQYRSKFKTDLKKAINALKEMGLITDGYFSKSKSDKGEMANFVINEQYKGQPQLPK